MNVKQLSVVIVGLACLGAAAGCSSSDDKQTNSSGGYTDHTSPYPACNAIIQWCHPYDVGEGEIHKCHDQGHEAKSDADCIPVKQHCFDTCQAGAQDAGMSLDAAAL